MRSCQVHVEGVVQGVGFRPFAWKLAHDLGVKGWIRNSSSGVDAHLEGAIESVERFLDELERRPPDLARIDGIRVVDVHAEDFSGFDIVHSKEEAGAFVPVSVDVATCPDCLEDIRDPSNRRYRYPFTNCTNCGPRFTIVRDLPYDRPKTTMADFPLCDACRSEYENPADRRFHAQPVACPDCGPRVSLISSSKRPVEGDEALQMSRALLSRGGILGVKGLGGYHLACDALQPAAVRELRRRKHRDAKPLALMVADLDLARRHVHIDALAEELLTSRERPIVLLSRRQESTVAPEVAPGLSELGILLPYTPLHELLIEPAPEFSGVLVLTSGNLSDEPIAHRDDDARERLTPLVDAMLIHDRPIHIRCDDSVVMPWRNDVYPVRRSRGYAPSSLPLPMLRTAGLAVGAELKNAFGLGRDGQAFLSHHIGDLEHWSAVESLTAGIAHLRELYRVEPRWVAHDLHPAYHSTRIAQEIAESEGLPAVAVQHHHAHIASLMVEAGLGEAEEVLGIALDGTGYGTDGRIWGGEFLRVGYAEFERLTHLREMPLPGGDAATRKPYRTALAYLREAGVPWADELEPVRAAADGELELLDSMLASNTNCPRTTSAGRLFDAVASLLGLCQHSAYEAQGPRRLESLARSTCEGYEIAIVSGALDFAPMLWSIVEDLRRNREREVIASRFHRGLADAISARAGDLADDHGLRRVALSGGSWQNRRLLSYVVDALESRGVEVLVHRRVPANDGGIALGQLAVAAARRRNAVSP